MKEIPVAIEPIDLLREELVRLELELVMLRRRLELFETRYRNVVGPSEAKLHALHEGIKRLLRNIRDSKNLDKTPHMERENYGQVDEREAEAPDDFSPSNRSKELFRKIVRLIHPDLTIDSAEKARRSKLLVEVHALYLAGDDEQLVEIFEKVKSAYLTCSAGEPTKQATNLNELVQIETRIEATKLEIEELTNSSQYALMRECEQSKARGEDLLEKIKKQLELDLGRQCTQIQKIIEGSIYD